MLNLKESEPQNELKNCRTALAELDEKVYSFVKTSDGGLKLKLEAASIVKKLNKLYFGKITQEFREACGLGIQATDEPYEIKKIVLKEDFPRGEKGLPDKAELFTNFSDKRIFKITYPKKTYFFGFKESGFNFKKKKERIIEYNYIREKIKKGEGIKKDEVLFFASIDSKRRRIIIFKYMIPGEEREGQRPEEGKKDRTRPRVKAMIYEEDKKIEGNKEGKVNEHRRIVGKKEIYIWAGYVGCSDV